MIKKNRKTRDDYKMTELIPEDDDEAELMLTSIFYIDLVEEGQVEVEQ